MAEGLAVVATISSILQLVDFTLKFADRVNDFKSGAGDIPKSLNHLKTELPVLRHTLQQIQDAIQEARFSDPCAAALKPVVEACNQSMKDIQSMLEKNLPEKGDGKFRTIRKSVGSVLDDGKIEGILKTLRGYVGTLTFYFAASSFMIQPLDAKLAAIRKWLSAPDPSVNFRKALELRQANTGQWLLESDVFTQWREKGSFVWLYGIPGCGKTVLSSTVVEDIKEYTKDDPGKALAYFYFDFNDQKKQDPEEMVRGLISHLLRECVKVLPGLDKQFSSHRDKQGELSLEVLLGLLRELIEDFPSTYLVIDALDECGNRRQLMTILKTISRWQAPGLHVILTSRREGDISPTLEGIVCGDNIVCIQTGAVDHDIRLYVRQQLEDDESLQMWSPDDKKLMETALTERSSGMFRLAACRLEILRECRNIKQLKQAILDLPPTLDETYNRILSAIKESDVNYAVRILRWLAFSERPLRLAEVAEVAALEADRCPAFDRDEVLRNPLQVLNICSSLVTIRPIRPPWDDTHSVVLAHYSVKEYLVSGRILESQVKVYSMETALCQQIIAKCCIQYLLQFDEPDSLTEENLHEYALADYSARNWTIHSRRSEDLEPVELILQLLELKETACLAWIRLCNPDRTYLELDFARSSEDVPRPLYLASQVGLAKVVKRLVSDPNVDVNETSGRMGNALQAASYEGYQGIVQDLVVNGADVNASSGENGYALHAASSGGQLGIVQYLVEKGAAVDVRGGYWGTALNAASGRGHLDIVRYLVEKGADVNARPRRFSTALGAASYLGHLEVVQFLVPEMVQSRMKNEAGSDSHSENLSDALKQASSQGHLDVVRFLVENGADVNGKGGKALWEAARGGSLNVVQFLVEKGAVINAKEGLESEALVKASQYGHLDVVRFLVEKGAVINAKEGLESKALVEASISGHLDVVRFLVGEGAKINAQYPDGFYSKALEMALEMGFGIVFGGRPSEVAEFLVERGARRKSKVVDK